ncbi:MAG TPA: YddF family protein [Candidatus Blautia ornithocaccae]|nr:YddF family protein [Candidatus Blautia ornithocaccae]
MVEKILEEIIEQLKTEGCIIDNDAGNRAEEIIRKHMNEGKDINVPTKDNDGWIPVEERLPENTDEMEVTLSNEDVTSAWYNRASRKWIVETRDKDDEDAKVVAWKLHSESYRPEQRNPSPQGKGEKEENMKLGILNTSILTVAGEYTLKDIDLDTAKDLVSQNDLDSAVGHASTAQIMTKLLGVEIPVNRQQFCQQPGQQALVFKLNGRPQEGKILTAEEIEQIGYKFQILERRK